MERHVNNYRVIYSSLYHKWQVRKGIRIYEEFEDKEDAVQWAQQN